MAEENLCCLLRDYAIPYVQGMRTSISRPPIEANDFELKPSLFSMVQQQIGQNFFRPPPNFQNQPPKSNLESLVETFVSSQMKLSEELKLQRNANQDTLAQLSAKVDSLATHSQMLEMQIAQQASPSSQSSGKFPGQLELNPREHCNAISVRSMQYLETPGAKGNSAMEQTKKAEESTVLTKEILREKPMGKELYNQPTSEHLAGNPPCPFFKEKQNNCDLVALTKGCSDVIQNMPPPKLQDPGSITIPCLINGVPFTNALCDLGASVSLMPWSVCQKLGMTELKPASISLQLADRSVKHPLGVLEDVPVKVGKFLILVDFMVLEMEEDSQIPIFLGRPFLATAGAIIDVKRGTLLLSVGEESVEFDLSNPTRAPAFDNIGYGNSEPSQDLKRELQGACLVLEKSDRGCSTEAARLGSTWKTPPDSIHQDIKVGGLEPIKENWYLRQGNLLPIEPTPPPCSDRYKIREPDPPDPMLLDSNWIVLETERLLEELRTSMMSIEHPLNYVKGINVPDFKHDPS